ncbi:MAG: hemolysin family protein [Tissierellia bacterium]|nr:hemolysin family protein [Tissierellia bacterium]
MNVKILIALSVLFLFFSFYFTMLSTSYRHMSQKTLQTFRKHEEKALFYIEDNLKQVEDILNTMLILDYFSNICLAVLFSQLGLAFWDLPGLILGVFISGLLILLLGEGLPNRIGQQKKEAIILKHSRLLYYLRILLTPLVSLVEKGNSLLFTPFDEDKEEGRAEVSLDPLSDALFQSMEDELLDQTEVEIIENVIDFGDLYAKDVMTPRTDIVAINVEATWEEIQETIQEEGFSRYPVYEEDLDNILGILHVKDLFAYQAEDMDLRTMVRPAYFTYEYKPVSSLFKQIRFEKKSVALVYDEYGGLEGMISTEDLIEEILGDITDEYDEDEIEEIIQVNSHEYVLAGSASLADFSRIIDVDLESEEFDTVAGYIIEKIDRFPAKGEVIQIDDLTFHILSTSKNRIERIGCHLDK